MKREMETGAMEPHHQGMPGATHKLQKAREDSLLVPSEQHGPANRLLAARTACFSLPHSLSCDPLSEMVTEQLREVSDLPQPRP